MYLIANKRTVNFSVEQCTYEVNVMVKVLAGFVELGYLNKRCAGRICEFIDKLALLWCSGWEASPTTQHSTDGI